MRRARSRVSFLGGEKSLISFAAGYTLAPMTHLQHVISKLGDHLAKLRLRFFKIASKHYNFSFVLLLDGFKICQQLFIYLFKFLNPLNLHTIGTCVIAVVSNKALVGVED